VLCVALSGGVAAEIGVVAAAAASVLLVRRWGPLSSRRVAVVAGLTVVCGLGVLGLRNGDLTQYARYIGVAKADESTNSDAQTFAQRELMYYIGLRVWLDKPVLGAGWQSIREQQVYDRFLPDAHARYPDQPEQAFPNEADPLRQYGIDNAYIQALAELGIVGLGLFLALLGAGLVYGAKRALRSPPVPAARALVGVLWLLVAMGTWAGQGIVAGASFAALSWFALGLAASGRDA
jgi:O-antigen ligase